MKKPLVSKRKKIEFNNSIIERINQAIKLNSIVDEEKFQHKKLMKRLDSNNLKKRIHSKRKRKVFYQNSEHFKKI
jgi:hypothetical protein